MMKFKVIDNKTGKEAIPYTIVLNEKWCRALVFCDVEGFAITEDGRLILTDECGSYVYCPEGRFGVQVIDATKGE